MSSRRLVHIVDDVPEISGEPGPVLLVALDGFLDAGNATALAVEHLTGGSAKSGRVVASFEVDELFDYRARRPPVTFSTNRYADYEAPRLVVRLLRDAVGTPYLLLSGPEPDIRWEAFARGVREVAESFAVRRTLALGSIPMAVPHTRPVQLTAHANDDVLPAQPNVLTGEIRVPSSAQALLEIRMGEWGHPMGGFVAHIPHYVAQMGYPLASAALLEAIGGATQLTFDTTALHAAAETQAGEITRQLEDSAEVREVVHGLEQQYDAFHQGEGDNLLAEGGPLPSADELGAQFEQFLAGLDDGSNGGSNDGESR